MPSLIFCFSSCYHYIESLCVCVGVCARTRTYHDELAVIKGRLTGICSLIPPWESWGLTSGCQDCWQAPLPNKLSYCPCSFVFNKESHTPQAGLELAVYLKMTLNFGFSISTSQLLGLHAISLCSILILDFVISVLADT